MTLFCEQNYLIDFLKNKIKLNYNFQSFGAFIPTQKSQTPQSHIFQPLDTIKIAFCTFITQSLITFIEVGLKKVI